MSNELTPEQEKAVNSIKQAIKEARNPLELRDAILKIKVEHGLDVVIPLPCGKSVNLTEDVK
ncbi:hypothetical protein [Acinetobacter sp. LMB-5]|uniref:hypothetical protein n=1 Tax=Acinetobacter sp. LMB-5 TaxID=1609919 RepID=UPI000761FBCE|nr:hypothetical protein [Acinetobacter sp. LMB-5]